MVLEALACGEAITLAVDQRRFSVSTRGDSLLSITALFGQSVPPDIQVIIRDFQALH